MPRFRVRAVNRSGCRVVTISSAKDVGAVRASLTERGWTVLSIKPVFAGRWRERQLHRRSNSSGVFLFRQLAELLSVGVPISTALEETQRLAPAGLLSQSWGRVVRAVNQGESLVDALASCKGLLAVRHLAALNAGQSQKDMSTALMGISEELEWRANVIQRWRQACTYPLFAVILLLVVCGFLLTSVVPSLQPMLQPMASELPWVTQQIISFSTVANSGQRLLFVVLQYALIVFVVFALTYVVFKSSKQLQRGLRKRWLACRFFQRWVWPFSVAAHARTVHLLLEQRISLSESVRLAAPAAAFCGTYPVWQRIAERVEHEGLFADAVQSASEIPSLYASLIRVGERHNTLESSLEMASNAFYGRFEAQMKKLDVLIGPIMLLLVGAMMACIIVWVLLPVYDVIALQGGIA